MEATKSGFQFGDVVVRPTDFVVSRDGKPISLEPKSFKVLVYLIENRNRVVTKDELMQAVWNGTAVTDNALTRVIAQLRRELGDDAKQPRYIETVPTVGYRFVADVQESAEKSEIEPAIPSGVPSPFRRYTAALLVGSAAIFISLALFLILRRSDDAHAARPDRLGPIRQFTVSTGVDQHPSFSPDGSSIAYSSDRSGRFEIYVQPLASGAREIQITSDDQQNLEPSWSPDGQYIAYYSHGKKGIFVIPALGGIARRLTEFGSQPTWSPDGTQIAFRSGPVITLVPIDLAPPTESTIWIVSSKGGTPRQLTKGGPEARHNFPSWSPDGKSVVYSSLLGLSRGIFSVAVSDGTLTRIPSPAYAAFYPIYNARGDGVYFVAPAADGGLSIWKSNVSGGEPQEVLHSGFAFPRELAIDKSGHRLSYTLQSMTSNLYSLDLKTGDSKVLVDDRSFRNTLPMFSPAGDRVAYLVQRFGSPGNIWTMDPDGGNRTRLTQNEKAEWLSGWINGGRGVAFTSMEGGINNLWTASLADGATDKVTALSRGVWVILSPTGKELVFHQATKGVFNIWKMALDTKQAVQLTFDKETMNFPSWSRDGEWIAFETWRGEDSFLSIMDRNGQRYTRLVEQPGHAWPYSWSPDGQRIAFAGMRDAAWNIWWVSRSDHSEKKLTDYKSLRSFVRYPAWSPNGDRIVYEFAETKGNIFLADLP
jgi:Tol biopolymer transport system component/DNA-binding winged helix-turn-helix (wHTH) protein